MGFLLVRLLMNRKGQDLVEYALISAFVAAAAVAISPAVASTTLRFSVVISLLDRALADTAARY